MEEIKDVKESKGEYTLNYFESNRFRFGYLRVKHANGRQEDGLHIINKDTKETISISSEDLIRIVPTLQKRC